MVEQQNQIARWSNTSLKGLGGKNAALGSKKLRTKPARIGRALGCTIMFLILSMPVVLAEGKPACNDGIDNDGDGATDYPTDAGCSSKSDRDESGPQTQTWACSDGTDNDGDGKIDGADPGCGSATDDDETDAQSTPFPPLFPPPTPGPILNCDINMVIRWGNTEGCFDFSWLTLWTGAMVAWAREVAGV